MVTGATVLVSDHALLAKEKRAPLTSLPGYIAVPVHYSHWNKMVMDVVVNGHRARFFVDTGAGYSILDAGRARSLGVSPVGADSPYGEFANLNGVRYRVGYLNSLRAGAMDFGSGPIALFQPASEDAALNARINGEDEDGIIGADILTRYKAVINCYTKTIFFKTGSCMLRASPPPKVSKGSHCARRSAVHSPSQLPLMATPVVCCSTREPLSPRLI
jgi:hypothetical protein